MTHRLSAGQMLTNRDEDTAEARGARWPAASGPRPAAVSRRRSPGALRVAPARAVRSSTRHMSTCRSAFHPLAP